MQASKTRQEKANNMDKKYKISKLDRCLVSISKNMYKKKKGSEKIKTTVNRKKIQKS
jgi:hypothetical protein